MTSKINLANKQKLEYKLEDFVPFFVGLNKRCHRLAEINEKNPNFDRLLDKECVSFRNGMYIMYQWYSSGVIISGTAIGITYLISLIAK